MLDESYTSVLLNTDSWKVFSPFTTAPALPDMPLVSKDITKHNSYEILVALEGNYPYYYNGNCYNCTPGSIFLISPMIEHESYYTPVSGTLTHMWMTVSSQLIIVTIIGINAGKAKRIYRCKISYDDYTPKLKIYEIWNSLITGSRTPPQKKLLDFKLAICHLFLAIIESKQMSANEYQNEIMQRARNYIKEHFQQRIDIDSFAGKMGYSKYHFIRLFKQYHTITIQEYIDQQRLKLVARLLADKVTQKEIAYKLGFSSRSSFANWYAKYRNKQIE